MTIKIKKNNFRFMKDKTKKKRRLNSQIGDLNYE